MNNNEKRIAFALSWLTADIKHTDLRRLKCLQMLPEID